MHSDTMTRLGQHSRALAAALALGAAVLSLSAGSAFAEPPTATGPAPHCDSPNGDGATYSPGTILTNLRSDGTFFKIECGTDGGWHLARKAAGATVVFHQVGGGGVLAPTP